MPLKGTQRSSLLSSVSAPIMPHLRVNVAAAAIVRSPSLAWRPVLKRRASELRGQQRGEGALPEFVVEPI